MFNTLRPLFESLKSNDVRYVVIGGVAAGIHGVPRATFDLDILTKVAPPFTNRSIDPTHTPDSPPLIAPVRHDPQVRFLLESLHAGFKQPGLQCLWICTSWT